MIFCLFQLFPKRRAGRSPVHVHGGYLPDFFDFQCPAVLSEVVPDLICDGTMGLPRVVPFACKGAQHPFVIGSELLWEAAGDAVRIEGRFGDVFVDVPAQLVIAQLLEDTVGFGHNGKGWLLPFDSCMAGFVQKESVESLVYLCRGSGKARM